MTIELQFLGYSPEIYSLPLDESPFERLGVDGANEVLESAMMGDPDDNGWVSASAAGEDFQVRQMGLSQEAKDRINQAITNEIRGER